MNHDSWTLACAGLALALCTGSQRVLAQEPPQLAPIRVQGHDAMLGGNMKSMTGNVTVLSTADDDAAARLSLRDVLSPAAGVYIENPAGQDNARLSIRGSGISNRLGTRGVRLLVDGVPVGRSDDTNDVAYVDTGNIETVEVYRGASGSVLGASTLGGIINFVSPTGLTRPGVRLRSEVGSEGYARLAASAGQSWREGADVYAATSWLDTDGGRENSAQRMRRLHLNLGYRPQPRIEHRLFVNLQDQRQEMPGPVTLAQALADPRAANAGFGKFGAVLDLQPLRTAYAYRLRIDTASAGRLTLSAYYNRARFETSGTYANLFYDSHDQGVSLRHEFDYPGPWGENQLAWGVNHGTGSSSNATFGPVVVGTVQVDPRTVQFEDIWGRRKTTELFLTHTLRLREGFSVVAGVVAARASRSGEIALRDQSRGVPIFTPSGGSATYWGVSPRLGWVLDVSPRAQVYGNVSKSVEPPTNFEFNSASGNVLRAQRAWTVELGTRGAAGTVQWDAAVYRSEVRDELLSVETMPGAGRYVTGNAPRTLHEGVELALSGDRHLSWVAGRVAWRLAYTFNRFHFKNDRSFGHNALPGIPRHVARVDATYHHPRGYFFGPYADLASGWYADQKNTLQAPGHALLNLKLGYEQPGGQWLVFLDVRNLNNHAYVASSEYLVDARGQDAQVFLPGAGRAVYAGVQIQL